MIEPDDTVGDVAKDNLSGDLPVDVSTSCAEPVTVNSKAALIQTINAMGWGGMSSYSSGILAVSDDIQVTGTLTLTSGDVALPPNCDAGVSYCRQEVLFDVQDGVTGVTIGGEQGAGGWTSVTFADAVVRFRLVVVDTHPSQYIATPVLLILASCESDCASGRKCPGDHVCYNESEYCRYCDAKTKEACACFTFDGPEADDSDCFFAVSGDVMCQGKCQDGVCEYTGTPGWAGCP